VTALEPGVLLTLQQRQGPFRQWIHTLRFEPTTDGSRLNEHIAFEPPGGLLGLVVTQAFIERDLEATFRYRTEKLRELLGE
jgi:ligand-binding SRPBCC domain-containing protein